MRSAFSSISALHDSLIEAAETERRLPPAMRKQKLASWPEFLQAEWLSYADEVTQTKLARASAAQISRYDLVLDAIVRLEAKDDRQLLWAAAHSGAFKRRGPAWSKLAKLMHTNRHTVKQRYEMALWKLFYVQSHSETHSES